MKIQSCFLVATILIVGNLSASGIPFANVPDGDVPPRGVISGTIAEEGTLDPMEYSTIAVYSVADSTLVGGTVSGIDGKFEIAKLPYGHYYVETNFIGYNKRTITPVLVTSNSRVVDLGMLEMSINSQAM